MSAAVCGPVFHHKGPVSVPDSTGTSTIHGRRTKTQRKKKNLFLCAFVSLWFIFASAAEAHPTMRVNKGGYLAPRIALNHNRTIVFAEEPSRVSVGNPEIADIVMLGDNAISVITKQLGQTNIRAWDSDNRPLALIDVEVVHELTMLKRRLYQLLPNERIEVRNSGKDVVLAGEITSMVHLDTALKVAESFAKATDSGSSVINMMTVGGARQVMLEVKVAEVQRNHLKKLGVNFNAMSSTGNWSLGGLTGSGSFAPGTPTQLPSFTPGEDGGIPVSGSGIFTSFLTGDTIFNLYIDAAKDNDIARILAEPTLTTISGSSANFLAGGEFPVPVASGNNESGITIDYKEYGVGLGFTPTVLSSEKINLNLNVSVSDVTQLNAVTVGNTAGDTAMIVPALNRRSADTTVELLDGQTIAIAGLVNETMRDVVNKFPVLGDIPIMGQLFRSQEFRKGQSELVIMVTPRLAVPLTSNDLKLPTDNFVEPSDREFYLMGISRHSKPQFSSPGQPLTGTNGMYGHDLEGGWL